MGMRAARNSPRKLCQTAGKSDTNVSDLHPLTQVLKICILCSAWNLQLYAAIGPFFTTKQETQKNVCFGVRYV